MRELSKKIDAIARETSPKIAGQALRAAMKPMLKTARANAPRGKEAHRTYKGRLVAPGFLKQNIKIKKLKRRDKTKVAYGLWATKEAWYGQLIETGTETIRSKPWLGPAYARHKGQVVGDFRKEMNKRINKAMKRIKSK